MEDVIDTMDLISRGLPDIAYIDNSNDVDQSAPKVLAVKRGESGYWPIANKAGLSAKDLNYISGVTSEQAEAMLAGSMFGWNCKGSYPSYYNKK